MSLNSQGPHGHDQAKAQYLRSARNPKWPRAINPIDPKGARPNRTTQGPMCLKSLRPTRLEQPQAQWDHSTSTWRRSHRWSRRHAQDMRGGSLSHSCEIHENANSNDKCQTKLTESLMGPSSPRPNGPKANGLERVQSQSARTFQGPTRSCDSGSKGLEGGKAAQDAMDPHKTPQSPMSQSGIWRI